MICPECYGDENHAHGCTRHPRHDRYWLGYRHGRRLAEHQPNEDHERALWFAVKIAGIKGRAFALGELRGYRQATDAPYVEAHRLEATDDQINRSFDAYR